MNNVGEVINIDRKFAEILLSVQMLAHTTPIAYEYNNEKAVTFEAVTSRETGLPQQYTVTVSSKGNKLTVEDKERISTIPLASLFVCDAKYMADKLNDAIDNLSLKEQS